jgi:hypothetical protein
VEGHEEVPGAEEAVTCWSGCFAGGSAVEAGGGVVAHGRQLQAAVLLFQAVEREIPALPFSSVFFPLLRLRFLFFLFLFMCVFFNSRSSSCFGIVPLPYLSQSLSFISHSPSPLFPASPFSFFSFFLSLSFLFFSFSSLRSLFFSLSSSCVLALGGIYRAKGVGASLLPPYCCAWGAGLCCPATMSGWLASGRGWQGEAPPVSHHEGTWGFGFGSARGEGDGHEELKKKKTKVSFFPCCASKGRRRRNNVAQNDTVLLFFLT